MLHPRLTPIGGTIGTDSVWLAELGPYGAWADLEIESRWGDGACGMYEAKWSMPLPPDFTHPLLRRGTQVEIMDGSIRVGSTLIMSEPARGAGLSDPWTFVCSGVGREVEGQNAYYADDGSGAATAKPATAAATAISDGWPIAGVAATVPTTAVGGSDETEPLNTVGALLSASADANGKRWGVDKDNILRFYDDPATPSYTVVPDVDPLGTSDNDYASVVKVRYIDSATNGFATATAIDAQTTARFGRREYPVDLTDRPPMSSATAQGYADSILAKSKGRLGWANSLTLTAQQLLTVGGKPASLSKVVEDVGEGVMIRLHGVFDDLLEYNGKTWLDVIVGRARYVAGGTAITLDPIGLAPRNFAAVVEDVTREGARSGI